MSPRITYLLALIVLGILHSPVDLLAQCQPTVDCNQNGVADQCDIDLGTSDDCNGNLVPDECDISFLVSEDCNLDGIPDECNPGMTELIGLGLAFGEGFGESISSSSEYAIIGAPQDDLLGTDTGSANIFRRTGTLWIEEMKLFGVASTLNDRFGTAVAVEGDLVAVGAPGKLQERGAVFLFRRIGNGWWNYESTITAFDSQPGWLFGNSLDIEGGSVLVGAPMNGFTGGAGAVYSYSLNAGQWLLDEKIEHSNGLPGDRFGSSVVQVGGRMAIGAPGRDSGLIANSGAALVFEESAGIWLESAFKEPSAPQPLGLYGHSVDLNRDHLLVGAPGEDSGAGSAYIYDRLSSMWINPERLVPDATSAGSFGLDVGLSIRTAVVGAPMAGNSQGTVCVYRYANGSWNVQDGFLPPELQMPGTEFGKSISCEVPFLLVGCPGELYGEAVWISAFTDCNLNLEDDVCDVTQGLELDCNLNQIPDSCEISDGSKQDCDGNGTPDECQIVAGELIDCNLNGVPDDCDIVQGFSLDCNLDSIPDDCQTGADPFNPVISNLPDPISVVTEPGQCGAVITWNPPVATDDCGISSLTSNQQSGDFFAPGLSIVTYTATDVSGNQSNAMFTILVHDEESPGISGLQPLFTVQAPIGTCEAPVSWPAPTPADNCGIFSTLVDHLPGSVFPVGITSVVYTVMDVHGNVSEFPFQVEVLDNHLPEILGISGDLSVVSDLGSCTAVVNWTEPTPQDDCIISSFESTHTSGEAFPIGVTEVVYTVTDSSGLTATAAFSISVIDDQAPTFLTAPADITMGNDPDDCGAVVGWVAATTSDNCAIASVTSSHQPGDHFPLGTTQVDVTALDVNGNSTSHSFAVVVNDTQMPVLTGVPADIHLDNDAGQCSATYNWLLPEFTDNCGVASFNSTHDSGTTFPNGQTTVSYVLTDLSGNILESSFVVTVEDVELPVISGLPTSFSVANDPGQCGANVNWVPPVASDNCIVADFDASHLPGIFLPIGITTIHYSVMDGTGVTTLASFEILVDDEEAPMINGMPADRTIEAAPGLCSVVHDWVAPLASDNCTVVTFDATHQPGDAFSVGTTEVAYTATDSTGMVTTDQFLITVVDTEAPTIIRIPADISIPAEAGICSAVADWIAPDSQDNCGIVSFSISHPSGTTFPTGDTLVSILTEDLHGNTAQASFTVSVLDQQEPILSQIPADITMAAETGICAATVTWTEPLASDNCAVATFGSDLPSGHSFPIGTHSVIYSATDLNGNIGEASFLVTITDDEAPSIDGVLTDVVISTDLASCGAIYEWVIPVIADNCGLSSTIATHLPGELFPHGLSTVVYSATDDSGNTTSASFDVTVVDLELPIISGMPLDVTLDSDAGACGALHSWILPEATDNCQILSFLGSHESGSLLPVGVSDISYTAQDTTGNLITAGFSVTVLDAEAPIISGTSPDLLVATDSGLCTAMVSWNPETATDNCGILSHTSSRSTGEDFEVGTSVVQISVIDIHGNESIDSFSVTVTDQELPQISQMPADISIIAEPSICGATVNWIEPIGSDNCTMATFTASHLSGSFFEVGTTPVTYSAVDASGNSSESILLVTITDDEAPQIENVLADVTLSTELGLCGATHGWVIPGLTDNCGIASTSASHEPGSFFPKGQTTVNYSITDTAGLTTSASFDVTVVDLELPIISGMPLDVTLDSDAGACGALHSWILPEATDNCEISSLVSSHQSGDLFPIGISTVTITTQDASSNNATSAFTVTVMDIESPVLSGFPQSIEVNTDPGNCTAVVGWIREIPTDNCGISEHTSSRLPGDAFEIGLNTVEVSATDLHGNQTAQQFTITVIDQEPPMISGTPQDASINCDAGLCGATVTWVEPTATDNCQTIGLDSDIANGSFLPVGSHTISYSVSDSSGNESTSSFAVTISDTEAPQIISFPADMIIETDPGQCGAVVTWAEPLVSDNCGIASSTLDRLNGAYLAKGDHLVTGLFADIHGNTTTETFTITVADLELPTIVGLPLDITLNTLPDNCGASADWTPPSALDNCPEQNLAVNFPPGSFFAVGTTEIRYVATDSSGNVLEQNFNVVVVDDQVPVFEGVPADITVTTDLGDCSGQVSWIPETVSDNCGILEHTSSHMPGDSFAIGSTTVEISVTDLHGNQELASFMVTVTDDEAPIIDSLPADISLTAEPSICGATVNWIEPIGSDNCTMATFTASQLSGSFFEVGTTPVTYSAVDANGNSSESTFLVTITDDEAPQIENVLADVTLSTELGLCGATHGWVIPGLTDNCGIASTSASHEPGSFFQKGVTTVSYSITDTAGFTTSASFDVTVVDLELPVISGMPLDVTLDSDAGACGALHSWILPEATDNCQILSFLGSHESGSLLPVGVNDISYTAQDTSGNLVTAGFSVTVLDAEAPIISGTSPDLLVATDSGLCTALVSWNPETATDNCGILSHTSSRSPGEDFEVGTSVVQISVIDIHGNESIDSFSVTVTDQELPQISQMPADITVTTQTGVCGSVITWLEPTASDNCGAINLQSDVANGNLFPVGSTLVTYSVEDLSGNTSSESFLVMVTEDEPPVIVGMPQNISVSADPGLCGASVDWIAPTTTDNCQVASQTSTHQQGDFFPVGMITVLYTSTDTAGNQHSESFTIEVQDQENPEFTNTPVDAIISVDPSMCSAVHLWTSPIPIDNCGIASLSSDTQSGQTFSLGTTLVSYSTTDLSGNISNFSFTVEVIDDEEPIFSGVPSQVLVNNSQDECGAIAEWVSPTADDNCEMSTLTSSHTSGSAFPVGETTVMLTATDAAGNSSITTFPVYVVDIQIPVIIGFPGQIDVNTDVGVCGAIVNWDEPTAVDNCAVDTLISNIDSGNLFNVGSTTVTYTATDVNGNTMISNCVVTVEDHELPQFINPTGDILLTSEPGVCDAQAFWPEIVVTDACGVDNLLGTHASGDRFNVGTSMVDYTATDANGNINIHSFQVIVADDELPVITGTPLDISVETDPGVCGAVVTWTAPLASDNCGVNSFENTHNPGDLFSVGDTLVSYTLIDVNANQVTESFTLTVLDTESPQISGLPESLQVSTDTGNCTAVVNWSEPIVTDNCTVISVLSSHSSGDVFPIGDTLVTYGVMDSAGIVINQPFLITVTDDELPLISNVPADMVVAVDPGVCGASVSWASPMATDNCGVADLASDHENGALYPVGTTLVTYNSTDVHGNVGTNSFSITVEDLELPTLTGLPQLIELDAEVDLCGAIGSWTAPVLDDNCEVTEITQTHMSGDFFPVGSTTVMYTVTDSTGNVITYAMSIVVSDVQAPTITQVPSDMVLDTTPGDCGRVAAWAQPLISDACGAFTTTSTHSTGDFFNPGITQVVYTAIDLAGNTATASFNVLITDAELPVIALIPEDQVVSAPVGSCSATANWITPTASDNCGVAQIDLSISSGSEFAVGTTSVLITATDTGGNQATAAFQITVLDQVDPQIVGMPADMILSSDLDQCGATVDWLEPVGVDGCNLLTFESNMQPATFFPVGITIVTYVATDESGNSVSASFSITILDDENPIVSAPAPVTITAPEGSCSAYVDVPELIVSDRCGVVFVTNDYNGTANASGVFPRGNTMINWMATDDSGNQSTAVGVITVVVDSPDCNLNGTPDSCDILDGISIDCNQDGIPDECQADCDGDGIPNDCEIELGTAFDCDADGYPDDCAIVNGIVADCDQDGVIDSCEILAGIESDCDLSGILDSCELSTGSAMDCNGNGQIDFCDIASTIELDCDLNGIVDSCQIATGASSDCDLDGVIDACEVANGAEADCNGNGSLDSCDLASGVVEDCNQNMVPDSCDLASGVAVDCNANGSLDVCDIASGIANDCDGNSVVDSCEIASGAAPDCDSNGAIDSCDVLAGVVADCNGSGVPDSCEVGTGAVPDCNNNGIPDSCDIASGGVDCDQSGVLDSCEIASGELPDCNQNGVLDTCDIASGVAEDCDQSGIPDNCEISTNQVADCNNNGIPDSCDLSSGIEQDCNGSGVPDSCEVQSGTTSDCNLNGVPDSCDIAGGVWADCDLDGVIDTCEIEQGTEQDCNATGIPDSCEIFSGDANDCDGNLIPDSCDLIEGTLQDCNGNAQPDECEVAAGTVEDCNGNGIPDSCDLSSGVELDEDLNGVPDSCQLNFRRGDGNNDGIVNIADGVFLLTNLFAGGNNPTCDDAADANDDGNIDVSDIISILGFQFNGASPPPPPFANCGVDPTVNDGLGCILYSACP